MNAIKSKHKSSMGTPLLDGYLRLAINGPEVPNYTNQYIGIYLKKHMPCEEKSTKHARTEKEEEDDDLAMLFGKSNLF